MNHKVFDDSMELAVLVSLAFVLLRQLLEVSRGLGNGAAEEADFDAARRLASDRDVEEHLKKEKKNSLKNDDKTEDVSSRIDKD